MTDATLETVLDDVLQLIAQSQRATTRRQLVRERFQDKGLVRLQLQREATAEARAQYRRNEEATKRKRRKVTYGNNKPTTLVASSRSRADAATLEQAADHLLQSRAERKKATAGRKMPTTDESLAPVLVRALLRNELEAWQKDIKPKSTMSKSVSKGMR